MKKCWYTVALAYSMAVAVAVNVVPGLVRDVMAMQGKTAAEGEREIEEEGADAFGVERPAADGPDREMAATGSTAAAAEGTGTESTTAAAEGTGTGSTAVVGTGTGSTGPGDAGPAAAESLGMASEGSPDTAALPREDFSHTLFIGDSRTVGLSEYGNLEGADIFAGTGMSVFNVFGAQVAVGDNGKQTLEQVLSRNRYETVYLMLGINELGYESQEIVGRYEGVVDKIRGIQPEATLVLEANLHVTQEKSEQSPIYNNDRINGLNREIERIAGEKGCSYIDVNEIFDDDKGNLDSGYSSDGSHVLGKYYAEWGDWIRKCQYN